MSERRQTRIRPQIRPQIRPGHLLWAGAALTGLALAWWLVIFGNIVSEGYGSYAQAGRCLWGRPGYICQLMLSLCTIDYWLIPKSYRPELFQAGAALLALGGAFALFAPKARDSRLP
ncbi:hypothetical protein HOY34_17520 [Xinfangfangia sp. D13-10-4-6]|uniref:hypothetical protein n=1 Tax=Pseudogemmobacter hezensis TaxID=2737662 RepID=UPI001553198E|nr:hypothetical protein [Pseudogemmobacter hezensis]NPD16995.1 hypothetical protein [Pseudogemmobacter hezensis]